MVISMPRVGFAVSDQGGRISSSLRAPCPVQGRTIEPMKNDTPEELLVNRFFVGEQQYALLSYRTPPPRFAFGLTESEWVVALFLLAGHSSASIATTRGVSARTVANQISKVFRKVGVQSRRELSASWADRLAALPPQNERGPRHPSP